MSAGQYVCARCLARASRPNRGPAITKRKSSSISQLAKSFSKEHHGIKRLNIGLASSWNRSEKPRQEEGREKKSSENVKDDRAGPRSGLRYRRIINNGGAVPMIKQSLKEMKKLVEAKDEQFLAVTGLQPETAVSDFKKFAESITEAISASKDGPKSGPTVKLDVFREAYARDRMKGVYEELKYLLQSYLADSDFSKGSLARQASLADLRYPYEWYAKARELQREVHVHIGPTNSGKTYHALKRLDQAKSGVYAGPLRLLAYEVFNRLNDRGVKCNLVTGDERIIVDEKEAPMTSCTVEMVPLGKELDIAVIDEIQMLGHASRGWAWTQAFLGLRAREIHLCGEERALPLIKELSAVVGDKLHVHRYERLNPLKTMVTSLDGSFKRLRKGDCVVAFSRRDLYTVKQEIEKETGKKVAIVYGSLPPEVRAQQARLFNDPDNDYDILVATDAIGMGLNLSIKRIVFESIYKRGEEGFTTLADSDIKQIGGRAGRYRVAAKDVHGLDDQATPSTPPTSTSTSSQPPLPPGLVTTLDPSDLPSVQRAMSRAPPRIPTAGLLPPDAAVARFAAYFRATTPFAFVLRRLRELAQPRLLHASCHFCALEPQQKVAEAIQPVRGLSVADRIAFCAAPAPTREPGVVRALVAMARCVEAQNGAAPVVSATSGRLLDLPGLDWAVLEEALRGRDVLAAAGGDPGAEAPQQAAAEAVAAPQGQTASMERLRRLEVLHKCLVLYTWLSYRFAGVFGSQKLAFYVKGLVDAEIERCLQALTGKGRKKKVPKAVKEAGQAEEKLEGMSGGSEKDDDKILRIMAKA